MKAAWLIFVVTAYAGNVYAEEEWKFSEPPKFPVVKVDYDRFKDLTTIKVDTSGLDKEIPQFSLRGGYKGTHPKPDGALLFISFGETPTPKYGACHSLAFLADGKPITVIELPYIKLPSASGWNGEMVGAAFTQKEVVQLSKAKAIEFRVCKDELDLIALAKSNIFKVLNDAMAKQ